MTPARYRYTFDQSVSLDEVEQTLGLTAIGVESLFGESQTRLDLNHSLDVANRAVVVDASTEVGEAFNRLFVGFVAREFGPGSFVVSRVAAQLEPSLV